MSRINVGLLYDIYYFEKCVIDTTFHSENRFDICLIELKEKYFPNSQWIWAITNLREEAKLRLQKQ
jgi:hypothetical protein